MTYAQREHISEQRQHAIKNHRVCYSMPAWIRDGFDSADEAKRSPQPLKIVKRKRP